MKDLEKAMAEEQLYLEDRMKNIDTSLIDRLAPYGYDTLKEYFTDKREHKFSRIEFNFVEEPMPNGVSEIFKMINTNKPGILFVDWEDTYVVCGSQGLEEFNREYCDAHNITFFPLYTNGGTIVGSVGDFSFGICCPKNVVRSSQYILDNVVAILQKYTVAKIEVNGNDIVADGNKICGSATYARGDVMMTIMHFSFNDWSDLISNICLTTKQSKPVGHVDFMTRDQFKKEVLKWLQKS